MGQFDPLIASGLAAAIPLAYAALGELVAERAGVLNLGVEGMMLVGALAAFAAVAGGAGVGVALLAAIFAGVAAAAAFAVLTLSLQASQVAAGLALTIFGTGVSCKTRAVGSWLHAVVCTSTFRSMTPRSRSASVCRLSCSALC